LIDKRAEKKEDAKKKKKKKKKKTPMYVRSKANAGYILMHVPLVAVS
jgi:hypothetical protein